MTDGQPRISLHGLSHQGGRDYNQDAFAIDAARGLAIIADGMGGLGRGEVASKTVVDSVLAGLDNARSIHDSVQNAHAALLALRGPGNGGRLGSTVVMVQVSQAGASFYWVGDSRAYLFRGGLLSLVTKDHSLVSELRQAGAITEDEAATHPHRHVLTRALGVQEGALVVDSVTVSLQAGDRVMLCSDGLCGYVSDDEIAQDMQSGTAVEMSEKLLERAVNENQSDDNVTVITILIES